MKTAAIIGAIACMAFTKAAVAQLNVTTSPLRPDYVAVMQALDKDEVQIDPTVTIIHHDGMFLSETRRDDRTSIGFGPDRNEPMLRWSRQADGEVTLLELFLGSRKPDLPNAGTPRSTGNVSTISGERCAWRETVDNPISPATSLVREQNCVTDDGIVIETKLLTPDEVPIYHTRLASLTRRPVALSEIEPPPEIMAPEFWLRPIRSHDADPSKPDFDITLERAGHPTIRLLRHYPWNAWERHVPDGPVSIRIWNELDDQGISYFQASGYRRLTAERVTGGNARAFDFNDASGKVALDRTETILGETCQWFDIMPGMQEVGNRQCLTRDGLPLKLDMGGTNATLPYTATSLRRRPVDLSEMQLPPDAFLLKEWGLFTVR